MGRVQKNKISKRSNIFFAICITAMVLLIAKCAYIQLIAGPVFAEAASRQQTVSLEGADRRAFIYDRNLTPLTGINREYVYIIKKANVQRGDPEKILDIMGAEHISGSNSDYFVYSTEKYSKHYSDILVNQYGAYIFECDRRYSDNQLAAHIIGYINPYDNKGVSGIEEELNDLLSSVERKTYVYADRDGRILPGAGGIIKGTESDQDIILTIDINIQSELEEILSTAKNKCAAVIIDSGAGEILAMASTPAYNPNNVAAYMGSQNAELLNKVTQGEYPPGSIFKLAVTAAALEKGTATPDTVFHCTGSEHLGNIEIGCSTGGETGHGDITLRDAFAYSCNSAFIQLGKLVGSEDIISMAHKMGLGETPLKDIPNINTGSVTQNKDAQGAGIGNLSIGQGNMLVTPLQIARLTNMIANNGNDIELSLIKNSDEIATVSADFSKRYSKRKLISGVISEDTSEKLRQMMRLTAEYGTASIKNSSISFAGKTGSAEDGKAVHGWFTGFAPAENPKYTITVFVEEGKSGRAAAVPIFNKIAAALLSND
ncbi:MAG: penicillin-binding protein 2 [Eubacteriales bacterium]|nr:penicillin-binding protein 2 [Eubacteriales bacterium]MDD4390621.1 penicillin-binding protein 2 [Eubacteriales bacterium]